MKKAFLIAAVIASFGASTFAQSPPPSGTTFSFTPLTQNVSLGGSFNVTLSLNGAPPPNNILGYDVYLVTDAANKPFNFTITASTPSAPFNEIGPTLPSPITQDSPVAGFVTSDQNLGYLAATAQPPTAGTYNFTLQTLTISIGSAPAGTYTFFTSTEANAGFRYGDVFDDPFTDTYTVGQGSFDITVVPEPSTWSMLILGGLGTVGLVALRRRRHA